MARKFAQGKQAWGECQRSGIKMLLKDMVEDGYQKGLMVHPDFYEAPHPQDTPARAGEGIALRRPAPPQNRFRAVISLPLYDVMNDSLKDSFPLGTALGRVSFD